MWAKETVATVELKKGFVSGDRGQKKKELNKL